MDYIDISQTNAKFSVQQSINSVVTNWDLDQDNELSQFYQACNNFLAIVGVPGNVIAATIVTKDRYRIESGVTTRITDLGDIRVTDDGQVRVTDGI